jgi:hypothetical protein
MNSKTKYFRRVTRQKAGKLDLLGFCYADEGAAKRYAALWQKYEVDILELWQRLFPCTRPSIWWWLNHADTWRRLKAEAVDGLLHLRPGPEAQRSALIEIGELESDEYAGEQRPFCFATFLDAYKGGA